jgi:GH15 family glucan-1,4-alpha-glucosidase
MKGSTSKCKHIGTFEKNGCATGSSLPVARSASGEVFFSTRVQRAVASMNDIGLLVEEGDPRSGELLGNFPQAFSHIGLGNTAWAISQAESRLSRVG